MNQIVESFLRMIHDTVNSHPTVHLLIVENIPKSVVRHNFGAKKPMPLFSFTFENSTQRFPFWGQDVILRTFHKLD